MNTLRSLIVAMSVIAFISACDQSPTKNIFEVIGTAEGFADGDLLQLTDAEGVPIDTVTIQDGKFCYTGQADSICLFALNVIKDEFNSVSFFPEPGTIKITLSADPAKSKVSGTVSNDALQKLTEVTAPLYARIQEVENQVYSDTSHNVDQWALVEKYSQIVNEINTKLREAARLNIDNELGFMLVTHFFDPANDGNELKELFAMMPEEFRQRQLIVKLENQLKALEGTGIGQKITDFSLNTPDGEPLSVMSIASQNKVTILDFWASWCGPCRREMPFMRKLYAQYEPKGLGIIGISLDEDADQWKQAINSMELQWPQISDLKGWDSSAAQRFQVRAIPFMLIIDQQGVILQSGLRGEQLEQFISQQLQ